MARFRVKWALAATKIGSTDAPKRLPKNNAPGGACWWGSGLTDGFEAGDIVEADLKDVKQFVALDFGGLLRSRGEAVLEPINPDGTLITAKVNRDELQVEFDAAWDNCRDSGKVSNYQRTKRERQPNGKYIEITTGEAIKAMRDLILADPKFAPVVTSKSA